MRVCLALLVFLFPMTWPVSGYSHSNRWEDDMQGRVTRCFENSDVKAHCENLSDPTDPKDFTAELQVHAKDMMGKTFTYSYEKGLPGSLCHEHLRAIRRLTKKVKIVCIIGDVEWFDEADGTICSKWRGLQTRKGKFVWW